MSNSTSTVTTKRNIFYLFFIVFSVALLIRAVFFSELLSTFPFYLTTMKGTDPHTYNLWAQKITAGDWLSREQGPFYFAPLYSYILAFFYLLFGTGNVLVGLIMNALFGIGTALLVAWLTLRIFGWTAGLISGLLMALNGSQLTIETMLLNDALIPLLSLAALSFIVNNFHCMSQETNKASPCSSLKWFIPGLLFGIAILGRASNLLVAVSFCLLLLIFAYNKKNNFFFKAAFFLGAGVFLIVGLCILRNGIMFDAWTISTNGVPNFKIGNSPGSPGFFSYDSYRQSPLTETGLLSLFVQTLAQYPKEFFLCLIRKTLLFFNSWDIPDNLNYYFIRHYIWTIKFFSFGPLFLYVAGTMGIVITFRFWQKLIPLYVFMLSFAVSIILIFVSGRFKLPFLALLCVFGGGGVAIIIQEIKKITSVRLTMIIVSTVILTAIFFPRGPFNMNRYNYLIPLRPNDFITHAIGFLKVKNEAKAISILEDGAKHFPTKATFVENLADFDINNRKPKQALKRIEAFVRKNRQVTEKLLENSVIANLNLSRKNKAKQCAQQLLKMFPNNPIGKEFLTKS